MPRFSIITAVYNAEDTILDTLNSVADQRVDLEHIIVDGGSADHTLDLVHAFPRQTHLRITSGRDRGIYDAMNKGLGMARGDIIGFLNADDLYAHPLVLPHVQEAFTHASIDSCYGDLVYVDPVNLNKITRYWKAGPFRRESFYHGWMPPHPTFFVRRDIYRTNGTFNLALGSAADYELMLRFLFKRGITTRYIPEVLIRMRNGGVSNATLRNRLRANRMDREAWRVNQLRPRAWTLLAKPLRKITQFVSAPAA